jgi:hypothetical protein
MLGSCIRIEGHLGYLAHFRACWAPWVVTGRYQASAVAQPYSNSIHTIADFDLDCRISFSDVLYASYNLRHDCDEAIAKLLMCAR